MYRRRVAEAMQAVKSLTLELGRITEFVFLQSGLNQRSGVQSEGSGLFADEIASMTDTLSLSEIQDLLLGAGGGGRREGGGKKALASQVAQLMEAMDATAEDDPPGLDRRSSGSGTTGGQRGSEGDLLAALLEEVRREVDSTVEKIKSHGGS